MMQRLPKFRNAKGQFKRGWHISSKGYPRYHCKPLTNQYVHRVQAAIMLGRALKKDEDVHHKNGDKTNYRRRNLKVLGHVEHGYISAKQHFYVGTLLEQRMREWYKEYGLVDDDAR